MNFGDDELRRTLIIASGMGRNIVEFLWQQVRLVRYALPVVHGKNRQGDRTFSSNEEFWQAVGCNDNPLKPNAVVRLRDFAVTEWMPRTPGLFHTSYAADRRRWADQFRMDEREFFDETAFRSGRGASRITDDPRRATSVIYDPSGKSQMIEGGIGCVRLKDVSLPEGRTWFMGATSSDAVHEGIPISLNDGQHEQYIEDIARGRFVCDLTARVRLMPSAFERMYQDATHLQQVYLEVEEIDLAPRGTIRGSRGLWVSAAVGFSTEDRHSSLFATYTTFMNGDESSLRDSVEWLNDVYVRKTFRGTVVTDFDQQSRRFAGAVFSLDSLLRISVDLARASSVVLEVSDAEAARKVVQFLKKASEVKVEANVTNNNTVIIGGKATTGEVNINQGNTVKVNSPTEKLSTQLEEAIAKCAPKLPAKEATALAKDGAALRKKLAAKKRDEDGVSKLVTRLERTATAAGKIGKPILKILGLISKAFF